MTKKAKCILALMCLCLLSVFFAACDTHTHTADDVWHSDPTSHWHECTEDGEKMDEAAHTAGTEWKSDGTNHWQECTVCGEEMNKTAHTAGTEWKSDGTSHWQECTVCGEEMNKTAHSPDAEEWHTDGTNHWRECEICGTVYSEQEHSMTDTPLSDAENHWKACDVCGETYGTEAHTPSTDYESNGTQHWYPCTVCGFHTGEEAHTQGNELKSDGINEWYECSDCGAHMNETSHTHEYVLNSDGTGLECWCNETKDIARFALSDRARIELGLSVSGSEVVQNSTTSLTLNLTAAGIDLSEDNIAVLTGFTVNSVLCGGTALDGTAFTFDVAEETLSFTPSAFGYAYGEQTAVFRFKNDAGYAFDVEVPVLLVSQVITTATQLSQFGTIAKACEADPWTWGGYFELGANITNAGNMNEFIRYQDYSTGGALANGSYGFKGIFDGCGYAIDGLKKTDNQYSGAFIGYMHNDGIIRDVSFTNAEYNSRTGSFLVNGGGGLIENVYIQYKQYTFSSASWGAEAIGTFFAHNETIGNASTAEAYVKNCIVEFSANCITNTNSVGLEKLALVVPLFQVTPENVYVILPDQGESDATFRGKVFGNGTVEEGASYNVYTSYDELKAAVSDWSGWNGDIWDMSDGYPVFKERPEGDWQANETEHWHNKGDGRIDVGTHTEGGWQYNAENHWKTCDVCDHQTEASAPHTESEGYKSDDTYHWHFCTECNMAFAREEHTQGDELKSDGTTEWYECTVCLTHLQETAHEHEYVLNEDGTLYICWCGDEKAATRYEIADRARVELGLSVDGGEVVQDSTTTLSIDLSSAGAGIAAGGFTVSSAVCGDTVLDSEAFAVSGETLTFVPSVFGLMYGEQTLVFTFKNDAGYAFDVEVPVLLVSQVITTATQLSQFGTIAKACEADQWTYGGYFELGNDIPDAGNMNEFITYVGATDNKGQIRSGNFGFKGVFDGCGYAIDGLTKTNNGNNGAFIGYLHNDGVIRNVAFTNAVYNSISGGFVVLGGGGLVENVYVQYAQFTFECNSGGWADSIGTFFADCYKDATATRVTTLRNCIVEFPENAVSYNAEGALQAFSLIVPSDNVTTVENVFAILPDQGEDDAAVRNQAFGPAGTQPGADDSFGLYTSYDELKAAVSDWSGWNGDIWDTSDGYPVFKDKAAA